MSFLLAPFQAHTYRNLAYLALAFPLGLAYFVFLVTGLSVGFGTIVVLIGIPVLLGMLLAWRALGTFERSLHRSLLGIDIPEPLGSLSGEGSLWSRVKVLLRDGVTWRTLVWLILRFPLGLVAFITLVVGFSVSIAFIASPAILAWDFAGFEINGIEPNAGYAWWLVPSGIVLLLLTTNWVNILAWVHGVIGEALLGPSTRARVEKLQTRTTALEERTRLAHELHDSIGHAVTLMVVQAGAGRKVFESDPDFARSSLETIEETGRRSLGELDRVLKVLRNDDGAVVTPSAPQIADLDALVAQVREAGVPVSLEMLGAAGALPRDLQAAAFRIIQEALTNVMRHAGTPAAVNVTRWPDSLELEVINEMQPTATMSYGTGRGIAGMRERVAAYGGESEIGPTGDGHFRVWVRFPST